MLCVSEALVAVIKLRRRGRIPFRLKGFARESVGQADSPWNPSAPATCRNGYDVDQHTQKISLYHLVSLPWQQQLGCIFLCVCAIPPLLMGLSWMYKHIHTHHTTHTHTQKRVRARQPMFCVALHFTAPDWLRVLLPGRLMLCVWVRLSLQHQLPSRERNVKRWCVYTN